jgi:hypothetical protein
MVDKYKQPQQFETEFDQIKKLIGAEKFYHILNIISTSDYDQIVAIIKLLQIEKVKREVLPSYFNTDQ